ncbi:MAG: hypothetical protein ACYDBV_11165, partial [Nitrospiria bacterium]
MPQGVPELQNFRSKYPEYSGMNDSTLAAKLASKYPDAYGDLPGKVKSLGTNIPVMDQIRMQREGTENQYHDYNNALNDTKRQERNLQSQNEGNFLGIKYDKNTPGVKANEELGNILSQPGQNLNKALGEFGQAIQGKGGVGGVVGNALTGISDLANAGLSTVGSGFGAADWLLRQLPGGQGASNILNAPFNLVGKAVQAGQEGLDKLTQGLPQGVKNLGLPQEQANKLSQSLSGVNQGLAQLLLAHGMDAGYKKIMPEKFSPQVDIKSIPQGHYQEPAVPPGPKQLKQPTDFYTNDVGVTSKAPIDEKSLRTEKSQLQNEIKTLKSKQNIAEDNAAKKRFDKFIKNRQDRINTIDKTLKAGYEEVKPLSSTMPDKSSVSQVGPEGTGVEKLTDEQKKPSEPKIISTAVKTPEGIIKGESPFDSHNSIGKQNGLEDVPEDQRGFLIEKDGKQEFVGRKDAADIAKSQKLVKKDV